MERDCTERCFEEAAGWYARLQSSDCTEQERAEFARWQQDPAHRQAFEQTQRISAALAGAAGDPRLRAMTEQALAMGRGPLRDVSAAPYRAAAEREDAGSELEGSALAGSEPDGSEFDARRAPPRALVMKRAWLVPGALAASLLAAVLTFGVSSLPGLGDQSVHYAATSSQRELTLDDGSVVHLDVNSEIDVQLGTSIRHISLHRGRALFDVAHDAERPFVVSAGAGRVTALGTVFQVYKQNSSEVVVTLAEGSVEVFGQLQGQPQRQRLAPGEEIRISKDSSGWLKQPVDADAVTSWSIGRHVFRDRRLDAAVDEVNRYAAKRVVIADPSLAALPVSGSFVAGDSESIVAAFAAVLPIRIAESGDELLLFRRRR